MTSSEGSNVAQAVTLLKQITTTTSADSKVPVWDKKLRKSVLKPVQELAGLLCYADPVGQTKGKDVNQFLTPETKKCLIDAIIVATSTSDMQIKTRGGAGAGGGAASGTMKL